MIKLFKPPRWIYRFFPGTTWRFFVSGNSVFLTFDDGPHPDITPFVLDELKRCNMKATFFCVGENLVRFPEIAERILLEGHTIGNHTMRHTNGSKVSDEEYFRSVADFEKVHGTKLFRPPYGKIRKSQLRKISKTHKVIMWTLLTYDFDLSVSEEMILRKTEKINPGEIIVLHDNPKIAARMKSLLPQVLQQLKEKGLVSAAINASVF